MSIRQGPKVRAWKISWSHLAIKIDFYSKMQMLWCTTGLKRMYSQCQTNCRYCCSVLCTFYMEFMNENRTKHLHQFWNPFIIWFPLVNVLVSIQIFVYSHTETCINTWTEFEHSWTYSSTEFHIVMRAFKVEGNKFREWNEKVYNRHLVNWWMNNEFLSCQLFV